MTKRIVSAILALAMVFAFATPAFAAPAQTVQQVFNGAALVPRESTNPTVAKYVKDTMEIINPDGKLKGYDLAAAIYKWVTDNLVVSSQKYVLPAEPVNYLEDAAIYGFKNNKGPCEVDAAVLVYLFRYAGFDAQWAFGQLTNQYHWWAEILIGDNVYAFDAYPGLEKSFAHRIGTVKGETKIGGFPHLGYFVSGGVPKQYGSEMILSDKSQMNRMKKLDGTAETSSFAVVSESNNVVTFTKRLSLYENRPDFSWGFPYVSKQEMEMADISRFLTPGGTKEDHDFDTKMLGGIAGKKVTVYNVKVGTTISLKGASMEICLLMDYKDGKLQPRPGNYNWPDYRAYDESNKKVQDVGGGDIYQVFQEGDQMTFLKEGYYIQDLLPWSEYHFVTNKNRSGNDMIGMFIPTSVLRSGYAVIHVVP
jgi:hypothetical protein